MPVFDAERARGMPPAVAVRQGLERPRQAACRPVLGGSADLAPSTKTLINGAGDFRRASYGGRNLRFGVREHAMGGIFNGMALTRGLSPTAPPSSIFSDYMRPTLRSPR